MFLLNLTAVWWIIKLTKFFHLFYWVFENLITKWGMKCNDRGPCEYFEKYCFCQRRGGEYFNHPVNRNSRLLYDTYLSSTTFYTNSIMNLNSWWTPYELLLKFIYILGSVFIICEGSAFSVIKQLSEMNKSNQDP